MRVLIVHEVVDSIIIQANVIVTNPSVVEVVEFVIELHLSRLISRSPAIALGHRAALSCVFLALLAGSSSLLLLLLGLGLRLLLVYGFALVPTVLLDGCERIIKLESGKHRLDEVLEAMTSSDIILGIVFWATNIFFIKIDRFDWLLSGDTSTLLPSNCRIVLSVLLCGRSPFLLLRVEVQLQK